jgi:predicted signal transduction protein with EAL and GGDEF domain
MDELAVGTLVSEYLPGPKPNPRPIPRGGLTRKLALLPSLPDEGEQIFVDLALFCCAHAVRAALVDLQRGALDELGRQQSRGTGYSSLSYLSALPITSLKIDRSFVRQIGETRESGEIVRAIVRLGEALGKQVIAEGVESQAQLDRLRELECACAQGFYLSRPLSAAQAGAVLATPPARQDRQAVAAA